MAKAKSSGQEFVDALGPEAAAAPPPEVPEVAPPVAEVPAADQPGGGASNSAPPPAEPAPSPFLEKIKGLGFENVETEEQARERLVQDYETKLQQLQRIQKEYETAQYYARIGQQYAAHLQDPSFANQMAQRQEPAPEEPKPWWNPPKYDPQLAARWRVTTLDEKGQPKNDWRPDTPVEIRSAHDQYNAYVEEWSEKLVHRPHEVLPPIIQNVVEPLIQQMLEERFGGIQTQTRLEQVKADIEAQPWMWEVDPRTQGRLVDPVTQQPVLSQIGRQVVNDLRAIREQGIEDPELQWEYARNRAFYMTAMNQYQASVQSAPAAPAAPAPTVADRNKQYLQRAAAASGTPAQRAGSIDPNNGTGKRPNRRQSPGHDLVAEMASQGVNI